MKNQTILLTGGTGTFGQMFVAIALKHDPKAIRIFSRGEYAQWGMRKRFDDSRLRFFIGDVRDKERVDDAMKGVDIVVHAAALKRIEAVEYNPREAIKTNILGTGNVVDAALDHKIDRFIALSTDKASAPLNTYGLTKAIMEKVVIDGNKGKERTRFSCTRYGNVLDSTGSVVEIFRKQDVLTITDPGATRFLILPEQGVNFVISCLERMRGGEIFIPKMPSASLMTIAEAVRPGAPFEVIGLRPEEKKQETLISDDESYRAREFNDYYILCPEHQFWTADYGGKPMPPRSFYASDTVERLTVDEIRGML